MRTGGFAVICLFLLTTSLLAPGQAHAAAADGPPRMIAGARKGAVAAAHRQMDRFSTDGHDAAMPILAHAGNIEGLAMAGDGTVVVARSPNILGFRAPDGTERWQKLPGVTATSRIVVAGPHVVWLGWQEDGPEAFGSTDGGQTSSARPTRPLAGHARAIHVDADGRLRRAAGREAPCGGGHQMRFRGHVADGELEEGGWPFDAPIDFLPGPGGWTFLPDFCDDAGTVKGRRPVCAVSPGGDIVDTVVLTYLKPNDDLATWEVADDGDLTWLAVDRALFHGKGGALKKIARLPAGVGALAVAAGSPWAIVRGQVHVFHRNAWRLSEAFESK